MSEEKRFYFDTNALWKFYRGKNEAEIGVQEIEQLVLNSPHPIIVSALTQLEFFGILLKSYRQRKIRRGEIHKIVKRVRSDVSVMPETTTRYFLSVPTPDGIFRQAEGFLLQHVDDDINSNDSLHIAIVKKLQLSTYPRIVMVSSDKPVKNVCRKNGIPIYDPEVDKS